MGLLSWATACDPSAPTEIGPGPALGGPGISKAVPQVVVVEDLGVLPGYQASQAEAINGSRQIVGGSINLNTGAFEAFLWTPPGPMTGLGTLGGVTSVATDINDLGTAVGTSRLPDGSERAFRWTTGGGMEDLGVLPQTVRSFGAAVNNLDQIVGWSQTIGGATVVPFLTDANGAIQPLPGLMDDAQAQAINDLGHVAGVEFGFIPRAFVWRNGVVIYLPRPSVGGSPGNVDQIGQINDAGIVVGTGFVSGTSGTVTAGLQWSTQFLPINLPTILPTLGGANGRANDVNNAGRVVGASEIGTGESRPFFWTGGTPTARNPLPGGQNAGAIGVSEQRHMVGWSEDANGDIHATAWWIYTATEIKPCICEPPILRPPWLLIRMLGSRTFRVRDFDPRTFSVGHPNGVLPGVPVLRTRVGGASVEYADYNGDGVEDLQLRFDARALDRLVLLPGDIDGILLSGASLDRAFGVGEIVLYDEGR